MATALCTFKSFLVLSMVPYVLYIIGIASCNKVLGSSFGMIDVIASWRHWSLWFQGSSYHLPLIVMVIYEETACMARTHNLSRRVFTESLSLPIWKHLSSWKQSRLRFLHYVCAYRLGARHRYWYKPEEVAFYFIISEALPIMVVMATRAKGPFFTQWTMRFIATQLSSSLLAYGIPLHLVHGVPGCGMICDYWIKMPIRQAAFLLLTLRWHAAARWSYCGIPKEVSWYYVAQ